MIKALVAVAVVAAAYAAYKYAGAVKAKVLAYVAKIKNTQFP